MKKKLKVLVLFDGTSPTSLDQDFTKEMKTKDWKTEADVMAALGALGHTAEHLAIFDDVDLLRQKLETFAPDVLFNLVEQFRNNPGFDQNIVSFFEMPLCLQSVRPVEPQPVKGRPCISKKETMF